jgi:ribose-phosphate pyrophosphokinase
MKIIFSTQKYAYLKNKVLKKIDAIDGQVEVKYFPDGERYQRILTEVDDQQVIIIGGTVSDSDTLELYDLACAAVKYGADTLNIFVPYFGYSTMERAVKKGEVVTAKTRARLLSSIPTANRTNNIFLFDLHTEGLPHYFEGNIKPYHVYCKDIVINTCKELAGDDFIIACTDSGRAKWVESLANELKVNAAFVFKRRISGDSTEITGINADVKGKTVIIYDDMIRTGGSLIKAAQAYKEGGAIQIFAITTHALFDKTIFDKIKSTNLFSKIVCTDTHSSISNLQDDFLLVKSIDDLIIQHL